MGRALPSRHVFSWCVCMCVYVRVCSVRLGSVQCPAAHALVSPPVSFCRRLQSQKCFSWRPVRFALILRMRMPCCPWRSPLLVSSSSALSFTPPSPPSPFSLLYFVCSHSAPVIVFSWQIRALQCCVIKSVCVCVCVCVCAQHLRVDESCPTTISSECVWQVIKLS